MPNMSDSHWEDLKSDLCSRIGEGSFKLWISPIVLLDERDGRLSLGFPTRFSLNWVQQNYGLLLRQLLDDRGLAGVSLQFSVTPAIQGDAPDASRPGETASGDQVGVQPELPYQAGQLLRPGQSFNPDYSFGSFVTGPCNAFALEAAKAMAAGGAEDINPLYIHAETGLGKSHLCQALGQSLVRGAGGENVLYLTAEDFTNQMVNALRRQEADQFKDRFRHRCSALILEEVQFLAGKEKTQSELAYALDSLVSEGKKVVFTASRPPQEIAGLRGDLASRLSGGVVASIKQPDYDTRLRIVRSKARRRQIPLDEEVAAIIARSLTSDVRRLESALVGLSAHARLLNRPLDAALAREVLGDQAERRPGVAEIISLVCQYYKLTETELTGSSRLKRVAQARWVALYLCRVFTELPLKAIGQAFGRNHTSVIYGLGAVEKALRQRDSLGRQVEFLVERLKQS